MAGAHLPFESLQRNLDSQEESGSVFPSLSGIWVMQIGGRIWLSNKNSFRAPANEKQQNAPARIQAHKRVGASLTISLTKALF